MKNLVRFLGMEIRNLQNVGYGKIQLADLKSIQSSPRMAADVLGIYGQNGSGKTTFVHAMRLLQKILSGQPLSADALPYITNGREHAELVATFFLIHDGRCYGIEYHVGLQVSLTDQGTEPGAQAQPTVYIAGEAIKAVNQIADERWGTKHTLIRCEQEKEAVLSPKKLVKGITDQAPDTLVNLLVAKKLAKRQCTSFLFSKDALSVFLQHGPVELSDILRALHDYGKQYLYVIDTRGWGPINLNMGLPLYFRVEDAGKHRFFSGSVLFRLDGPTILPKTIYEPLDEAIRLMNPVLEELVPGLQLELRSVGKQIMPDGKEGRAFEAMSIRSNRRVPFRYESEGIKKIVAILNMFIAAYADPSLTLVIDELDAGIFEYLLGELLSIFEQTGSGQLIFTSHNLRPLETLHKRSVVFTTVNPQNRYLRLKNIKRNNNLRSVYYNDLQLGGTDEELYEKTNNAAIRYALRQIAEQSALDEEGQPS